MKNRSFFIKTNVNRKKTFNKQILMFTHYSKCLLILEKIQYYKYVII